MVKCDVRHNYYADLELPTTCSLDDIKKQYRKLALQYHPDRNAGREEEFVPKFQAIQTAHEVLGDPTQRAKYDADRRKAGLYPTSFRPGQPTGNPYAATSQYAPPPRRTQPGTYHRPQPYGGGPTRTGADRFTNFPNPRGAAPTAQKNPAQDRTNAFRAWQNMNNAQERQQQPPQPPPAPPQPPPRFAANGAQANAQPSPSRPRPPPRQDTKMPSEEEIRAGMKHRKPPPHFDAEAEARRSAWAEHQQNGPTKAGVNRSNTTRTPRRQGFDPNAPGSDERPAGGTAYTRHRSEDFGKAQPNQPFPPPPPGPPPLSPLSPTSPTSHPPFAHPSFRPDKTRTATNEDQVPYSEANRKRTPYTSFIGERTQFSSEGLRRTASTRDATKLNVNGTAGRARSTSPLGRQQQTDGQPQPFVNYSDSDASDNPTPVSPRTADYESAGPTPDPERRSGTAPHSRGPFERPKKVPTPPSRRFNGSTNPFSPPPQSGDSAASDSEPPGMQQKNSNNMYVNTDPMQRDLKHSPFDRMQWTAAMFGSSSASNAGHRKANVPTWAIPSSVQPGGRRSVSTIETRSTLKAGACNTEQNVEAAAQLRWFIYFRAELRHAFGEIPNNLDMDVFLKLASTVASGTSSGHAVVDRIMQRILSLFPSLRNSVSPYIRTRANQSRHDSFTFPINPDLFSPTTSKSRSEENINTKFTPDGWNGTFQGSPDYFAPPPSTGRKPSSPPKRQKSGLRSATTSDNFAKDETEASTPETEAQAEHVAAHEGVKFSKEQWEKTFQDASWTWPPPPPKPPSPGRRTAGRKASKTAARSAHSGSKEQPHVLAEDDDDTVEIEGADGKPENGAPLADNGDAMDIDSTPPAQHQTPVTESTPTENLKEPRLYNVSPSAWRQQQQAQVNGHHRKASRQVFAGTSLNATLDDLANTEPIGPSTAGLQNLGAIGTALPFQSKASSTLPTHPIEPQKLQIPALAKAPEPPTRLTKDSWHTFARQFRAYLQAYHAFNTKMLDHFAAREHQAQLNLTAGIAWLEATGDTAGLTSSPTGFGSYLQGVKEDEVVREAWNVGSEKHTEAVKGFEKIRERVKNMTANGTLLEH